MFLQHPVSRRSVATVADRLPLRVDLTAIGSFHSVVIGEPESVWQTLLADAERGRLQPRYVSFGTQLQPIAILTSQKVE